jgi:hypothetical protein
MLVAVLGFPLHPALAASPLGSTETPQQTVPQGPPGADNGKQIPPSGDEEVIPPPPTGDEDIYTDAPNPHAGHKEEVIPPPATAPDKESSAMPR